jgi:hypothetical protein
LSGERPPGPWHEAYQTIDDPVSIAFVSNTFEQAVAEFGAPVVPVKKVLLRRSRKSEAARRYRIGEDFSLTECVDATNGVFVIYIGVDTDHRNYYALLGHECLHLLNPYIIDWYMEGMATVFSEQVCREANLEWADWKRHFMRSRREPYALSYRMMLELRATLPDGYRRLIGFTDTNGKGPQWLRIDVDAWLETLAPSDRQTALGIIEPYADNLKREVSDQYYFTVPASLR